jgi:hypothetical protein
MSSAGRIPTDEAGHFVLRPSPSRPSHRAPLALECALAGDGSLVHVRRARTGERYTCPCHGCGAPLQLRAGPHRRAHFSHLPGSNCINPGTLHRRAIEWVVEERAIYSGRTDLLGGLPDEAIIDGTVRPEYTLAIRHDGGCVRYRRADVVFLQAQRLVALEFVRTHSLDHQKLRDYALLTGLLKAGQQHLQLLVVDLWPDQAAFHQWDERAWRDYVLFTAPRRWVDVPAVGWPHASSGRKQVRPAHPARYSATAGESWSVGG